MVVMRAVTSSNIKAIGFDGIGTLRVEFLNGGIYDYSEVPVEVYDACLKADSVGKYFSANIKPVYKFTKQRDARAKK